MLLGAASLAAGNGGIARLARLTARALLSLDLELEMLSYLDQGELQVAGSPVVTCGGGKLRFLAKLHAMASHHRHLFFDSVGVARARPQIPGLRRPHGLWMCGVEVWEGLSGHAAGSLREAALPLAISHYTLDRYRRTHGELPQARICWLGTEEDAPPEYGPHFSGPPLVLLVGRIDSTEAYSKGHHELIQSWPAVIDLIPDARLAIVGGGSGLEKLRAAAAASPAAASIEVPGFVSETEIGNYWRRAHVFAMPSRGEGFGLVYIEAMRWGLPVIASVHDAGGEVNVDGETGYNVSLDHPDELSDRLVTLLSDPARSSALGRAARARWETQFRFSAFRERFAPLISEFRRSNA